MKTLLAGLLICGLLVAQEPPLTNQRVVELARSGVHPDELARMIQTAPQIQFDLSPGAESQLLKAGVSEDTIRAMAGREAGIASTATTAASPVPAPKKHRNRVVFWTLIAAGSGLAAWGGYQLSNPHAGGNGVAIYPNGHL